MTPREIVRSSTRTSSRRRPPRATWNVDLAQPRPPPGSFRQEIASKPFCPKNSDDGPTGVGKRKSRAVLARLAGLPVRQGRSCKLHEVASRPRCGNRWATICRDFHRQIAREKIDEVARPRRAGRGKRTRVDLPASAAPPPENGTRNTEMPSTREKTQRTREKLRLQMREGTRQRMVDSSPRANHTLRSNHPNPGVEERTSI